MSIEDTEHLATRFGPDEVRYQITVTRITARGSTEVWTGLLGEGDEMTLSPLTLSAKIDLSNRI